MNTQLVKIPLESVSFWRALALILMSFVVGNGVSFVVFGLHAATKADVTSVAAAQGARDDALDTRLQKVEQSLNYLAGELHQKGIDAPPAGDPK